MNPIVEEVRQIFTGVRTGLVRAMQGLIQIKEEGSWKDVAANWGEFVEEYLGISQSFASKLITTGNHYLIENKVAPEDITGIDYERLYLSRTLPMPVEKQIEAARTLTRRELKEERNEDKKHDHEPISICRVCGIRL